VYSNLNRALFQCKSLQDFSDDRQIRDKTIAFIQFGPEMSMAALPLPRQFIFRYRRGSFQKNKI
jgi:hypothetical protein